MSIESDQGLSRRQFLRLAGIAGFTALTVPLLEACGGGPPHAPTAPAGPTPAATFAEGANIVRAATATLEGATATATPMPLESPTPTPSTTPTLRPLPVVAFSDPIDAGSALWRRSENLIDKYRGGFSEALSAAQDEVRMQVVEEVVFLHQVTKFEDFKALSVQEVLVHGRGYNLDNAYERVLAQVLAENWLAGFVRGLDDWSRYTLENASLIEDLGSRVSFVDEGRPSMIPVERMLKLAAIAKTLEGQGRSLPKMWAMAVAGSPYARYDQSSETLYYDPYLVLESLGIYIAATDQKLFQDFNSRLDAVTASMSQPLDPNVLSEINSPAPYEIFNEDPENIFATSFARYMDFGAWARGRIAWSEVNDPDTAKIMRAQYEALKDSLGFETRANGAIWTPHVFNQGDQAMIYESFNKRDSGSGVIVRQNPEDDLRGDINGAFHEGDQIDILSGGRLTYFDDEKLGKIMYEVEGHSKIVGPLTGWVPDWYLLQLQG